MVDFPRVTIQTIFYTSTLKTANFVQIHNFFQKKYILCRNSPQISVIISEASYNFISEEVRWIVRKVNDVRLNRRFVETNDEEEACRLLFNAYYETVFNAVKRRRWNHPDTVVDPDEITSDTFIKAVKKRKEIQEPEKLVEWMERYFLDRQSFLEITEALGISRSTLEETVKRVRADWKKAAKDNPTDPVSAMVKTER